MRALSISHQEATALFLDQLEDFTTAAEGLSDLELLSSSRCRGWSRLDVVVHVRIGLEELTGAGAAQTQRVVDHDAASYWSSHPDDRNADPVAHILWLRRTASAYVRPSRAVKHLREVAQTAAQAVRRLPETPLVFQRKVLTSGDFVATWVVELAVHQLDLKATVPPSRGLGLARQTIEAIADADLPPGLDDRSAVLIGLGRRHSSSGLPAVDPRFPVSL